MKADKIPNGCLKQINKITNISVQELSDYAATRKRPRPERCEYLEKITGIPKSIWMWGQPEQLKMALSKYHTEENTEL